MSHPSDHRARCSAMLALLNREKDWRLSEAEQQAYLAALVGRISDTCDDTKLQAIITNYYLDHVLVEALGDQDHPQHDVVWSAWMNQTVGILRQARLAWSNDASIDEDDLVQVAQAELVTAIGSFNYASRFKTWAYRVVIWSVQRKYRALRARKRLIRPDYIDQSAGMDVPVDESTHPDVVTSAHLLAEQVDAILSAQPDKRLKLIFRLWAQEERSVKEISAIVHLHSSRVRVLLRQARQILQNDPRIRTWQDPDDDDPIEVSKDKQ